MEQATTGSRECAVNQRVQEQAGSTLERFGHFQRTGCIAHQPQVSSWNFEEIFSIRKLVESP